jgi:hypothetical protein
VNAEDLDELVNVAARHGLYLRREDVVIDGLPEGWAIIPRHWGRGYYDFTIMPPTCLGWSGGDMQRLRRTIKQARKSIAEHVARCERCKGTTFPVRRGMLARLRGLR